jgi:phosphoglycolate phosphatase
VQHATLLILWDIDQTLLSFGDLVFDVYEATFSRIYRGPISVMPEVRGRTDLCITEDLLDSHGIQRDEASLRNFLTELSRTAQEMSPRMRELGIVMPGTEEVLHTLSRQGVVQSVVTGNIRAVATQKLRCFGLDSLLDLSIGEYGDFHRERARVVAAAIDKASLKYASSSRFSPVVVVGDTPHDVKGARESGAIAIGVASGSYSSEELQGAGADIILDSLSEPTRFFDAIKQLQ